MDTCRGCDGRKVTVKEDRDNCFTKIVKDCSRCQGTGNEPEPSKGKRRFSRPKEEKDESEMSIEELTQAFLRKHGY